MSKTPSRYVSNKNGVKLKLLRRYVPSVIQIVPLPPGTTIHVKKKKHFATKFKNEEIQHECIVKFHKLLDKNPKFAKSNMRLTTLHD
jgi:hypothetical protein